MSKILEALQHLDSSIVPIVLPSGSRTTPSADVANPPAKTRQPDAGKTSVLRDEYSEIARRIRAKLSPPATIFVASAPPMGDDGWLAPLCVALGQQAQGRTLIVESSRASSYWSAKLGLNTGRGLSEAIGAVCDWRDTVHATPIENVNLIPIGQAGMPLPTRLADRMAGLASQWKQTFRWTIISGGEAGLLESAAFAAACNGSLLVISLAATRQEDARLAYKNLQSLGGKVIGCVARPPFDGQI